MNSKMEEYYNLCRKIGEKLDHFERPKLIIINHTKEMLLKHSLNSTACNSFDANKVTFNGIKLIFATNISVDDVTVI